MKKDELDTIGINKRQIRRAIDALSKGFLWASTKEGHVYWSKLIDRLMEMEDLKRLRL